MKSEIYLLDKKIRKMTEKIREKQNFGILTTLLLKWNHCDINNNPRT